MGRKSLDKLRIDNEERKLKWVKSILPVFQERGLKKLSMDEVAGHLGVSKATLYKYFSSREEILTTIIVWKLSEIRQFETLLLDKSQPYIHRFFNAIKITSTQLTGISTLFLSDLKILYPDIYQNIGVFIDYVTTVMQSFYEEGINNGAFNPFNPELSAALDRIFFSQVSDPAFLDKYQTTIQIAMKEYLMVKFSGIFRSNIPENGMKESIESFIAEL